MQLFDAYLPLGRTNGAVKEAPPTANAALALMDRYDVTEALVGHVLGRDCNPVKGNLALGNLASPRLHKVFAFEPAFTAEQAPAAFLEDARARGAKAVLVNPGMGAVNIHRSPRVRELADLLAARRIPLLVAHNLMNGAQDSLDRRC